VSPPVALSCRPGYKPANIPTQRCGAVRSLAVYAEEEVTSSRRGSISVTEIQGESPRLYSGEDVKGRYANRLFKRWWALAYGGARPVGSTGEVMGHVR